MSNSGNATRAIEGAGELSVGAALEEAVADAGSAARTVGGAIPRSEEIHRVIQESLHGD